jgi:predicted DCC family thiol-disulfide oxidoreductase YuxK
MSDPAGPVVLYDGLCGFCNAWVTVLIEMDRRAVLRYAPLQGAFAAEVLSRHPDLAGEDTLVLVEHPGTAQERVSLRSTAVLRIARHTGGAGRFLLPFGLVPRPLRDWWYDRVARRRHERFGRYDSCPLPPEDVRSRFLD